MKATLTKEVCVETANSVGIAAKLTELVSNQAKANIRAGWASAENGKGHFSLITDNNQKVIDALKKDFPNTKEHDVLVVSVKDSVGNIADVAGQLSNAGLNIDFIYTTSYDNGPAIILSTNDNAKALGVFNH